MNNNFQNKIIVVVGPTASGKSDLAIKLAKKYGGEVISADSRQIFKDMDLGTGKEKGVWQKIDGERVYVCEGIIHHLIDFISPSGEYNISHFKKDCNDLIEKISQKGKLTIICGGTGFWVSAVVYDRDFPEVLPDEKLRKKLASKNEKELLWMLEGLDPVRVKTIDGKNKIRIIRAIEIAKKLGKVPEIKIGNYEIRKKNGLKLIYQKKSNKDNEKIFFQIGIKLPNEDLAKRIRKRLGKRFEEGMLEETKKVIEKYNLDEKKLLSFGLGYVWMGKFFKGEIDFAELEKRFFLAEKNYARRQMTWFSKDEGINWIDRCENNKASFYLDEFLKN